HLQRRGGGVFVVIAASEALVGSPDRAPYAASKHATVGLVKSAALELAPMKIRVNAVAPGAVDNRMMRSVESQLAPGQAQEMKNQLAAAVPMARYALNEEIAELTLFLCGTRSSYSTGSVFVADGGVTAR
ncbi:MAG TPA: SDR family oxidoreductase, partial [Archangium sp.]